MKKFYSVIAAAAVGSLISASAFTQLDRPVKTVGENFHTVESINLNPAKDGISTNTRARYFNNAQSRAGEGSIDITKFTQSVYYDYFFNWADEAAGFKDLRSSSECIIVNNGDGTYTLPGLGGYNVFNPTLYVTSDGNLVMKAGELLYTQGGNSFILVSLSQDGYPVTEGDIPFEIYVNGIATETLGIYVVDSTGKGLGWQGLYLDYVALLPNATLKYSATLNGQTQEINNRIYVDFLEADPEADENSDASWDRFSVTNITPFNAGVEVNLLVLNDNTLVSLNAVAMESMPVGDGTETGDFYFSYLYNQNGQVVFDPRWVVSNVVSEYEITWPHEYEGITDAAPIGWTIASYEGYTYGEFTNATLTIDHEGTEGITDIINDNSTNAPAVYYNLQGVQVANPTAGQIYIVKNGNQVSKQIIK